MTKGEAIELLNNISIGDTEATHIEADQILLQFLSENGFIEVARAWSKASDRCGGFWYA